MFCKRQISATSGVLPGWGSQGWALPALWKGGLARGQCLALRELMCVGRDECAWPWGREGAGLRLEVRGDLLTPLTGFAL